MATLTKIQSDSPKTQSDSPRNPSPTAFLDSDDNINVAAWMEAKYPREEPSFMIPKASRRRTPVAPKRKIYKIDFYYHLDMSKKAVLEVELPNDRFNTVMGAISGEPRLIGYIPQRINGVNILS